MTTPVHTKSGLSSWTSVALGIGLLFGAATAEAKIATVSVTGVAAEVPGDKAATLNAVKRAARRLALEEGAGVSVKSNTIVRNFQMVMDEIATTSKGVLSDEQWGEMSIQDGAATISLTAKVAPEAFDDAICNVVKANHDPRIALVFVEKVGDESQSWSGAAAQRGLIEAMFTESFMENCFTIVESGVKVTEVSANGDLPQETIKEIVENAQAQYVLLGQGKILKADASKLAILGRGKNKKAAMNSYSLSASVKLLSTETNTIEAVASNQVQVLGLSPAHAVKAYAKRGNGNALVGDVMNDLFKKITERWTRELADAGKIQVTVKGVTNYRASKDLRKGIQSVFPNAKIKQRSLKKKVAQLEIELEGGTDEFAARIDEKKFGKKTVEILEVGPKKVILQLN